MISSSCCPGEQFRPSLLHIVHWKVDDIVGISTTWNVPVPSCEQYVLSLDISMIDLKRSKDTVHVHCTLVPRLFLTDMARGKEPGYMATLTGEWLKKSNIVTRCECDWFI